MNIKTRTKPAFVFVNTPKFAWLFYLFDIFLSQNREDLQAQTYSNGCYGEEAATSQKQYCYVEC